MLGRHLIFALITTGSGFKLLCPEGAYYYGEWNNFGHRYMTC